jgi:uncharacterized membrane protein (UPF0127 family)
MNGVGAAEPARTVLYKKTTMQTSTPTVYAIDNLTRDRAVATRAELARSFLARGRGLMGRAALPEGYALIIYPESSIHMFFMKIAIDVLFVDKRDRVVALRERLAPWHAFAGVAPWRGQYVIELPAGVVAATGTQAGDELRITPSIR